MSVFLYCLFSFSAAWLVHLLIWRIRVPRRHTRALLLIFLSVFVCMILVEEITILPSLTLVQMLHVMIFYIPTMLAYICFYSAIEEESPSVALIELTASKGACKLEDYYSIINNQLLLDSRLQAMVRDGLLIQEQKNYRLTRKGIRMSRLFNRTYTFLQSQDAG